GGDFAGDVVLELRRSPPAGGVVEHFSACDWGEGNHGIDGEGLPYGEAEAAFAGGFELLGKDAGVGGCFEDFLGNFAGDLVVAVAVGDAAYEGGDDDLGALAADGEDSVIENAVMAPLGEGFFLRLREAEVDFGA